MVASYLVMASLDVKTTEAWLLNDVIYLLQSTTSLYKAYKIWLSSDWFDQ